MWSSSIKHIKYVHNYTCRYSQTSEDTPVQNFLQATTLSDDSLRVSYMYKYMYITSLLVNIRHF